MAITPEQGNRKHQISIDSIGVSLAIDAIFCIEKDVICNENQLFR